MTQTLSVVLRRQHTRMGGMLADTLAAGGPARCAALARLKLYVAVHEAAEQTFLHPLGRATVGDTDMIECRLTEEAQLAAAFSRLERLEPDSAEFALALGLLEEAVLSHARAEEEIEVAALTETAGAAALERVAAAMALVDAWAAGASPPIRPAASAQPGPGSGGRRRGDRAVREPRGQ